MKNTTGIGTIRVPCGACPGCKKARAAAWAFRLEQESKVHQLSLFITLTYADEHVKGTPNGLLTLDKKDLQNFFKRLRKSTRCKTIKYYACSEYGGTTHRPHYHAILFDATPTQVLNAWPYGRISCDTVTPASIRYVTGYVEKPSVVNACDPNDDREKERSFQSKGLGANYLGSSEIVRYHENGTKSYLTLPGGVQQCLPRYYRDRLFTPEERAEINEKQYSKSEQQRKKQIQQAGSPEIYEHNRREAIKAAMDKYNSQRYSKRNKI